MSTQVRGLLTDDPIRPSGAAAGSCLANTLCHPTCALAPSPWDARTPLSFESLAAQATAHSQRYPGGTAAASDAWGATAVRSPATDLRILTASTEHR